MNKHEKKAKIMTAKQDDFIHNGGGDIARLLQIMEALRDPQTGCPWDIAQDFASIAPYTIEEAYEVADAIMRESYDDLTDELGDLLLQTVYHSQMAAEAGLFNFADVVARVSDKMVTRHPHVFGEESCKKSAEQQTQDWENIKATERGPSRVLDGVVLGLPALMQAIKLQKRAARVGFDWPKTTDVLTKINEEIAELIEAKNHLSHSDVTEEFGDLLFVMANLARHLDVDPEAALRATNAKFTRRFAYIEDALAQCGKTPAQSNLAEMDVFWNEIRARDKEDKQKT
jgi:ATP diphosphatase